VIEASAGLADAAGLSETAQVLACGVVVDVELGGDVGW
jgi:hypothetical protein